MTETTTPAVNFDDVIAASARIRGGIYYSPCPASVPLSLITGCEIYCKLDYLQRTGSFKERGARNALLLLSSEQRQRGVIAASAGNHALGLAYHGKLLNIPVTVVMPTLAPIMKVATCQQLGAEVVLHGEGFADARRKADELAEQRSLTYIHGYDAPAVIAGQGTMGLEIVEQVPDLDAIIIPIGGAGLIAGVALAIKTLKPHVRVIGVEPRTAASFKAALDAGHPVDFSIVSTLADGLAVPKVGENAFAIARDLVDELVLVDEHAIALAVLRLLEREKSVVEGAGATPLAACLSKDLISDLKGKKVVLPLCGGNIDTTVLGRVIERGLAADGRMCRFMARISDLPGGLSRFAAAVGEAGASIKDIHHDRIFAGDDLKSVNVHCVVETRDFDHIERLRQHLEKLNFRPRGFEPGE